MKFCENNTLFRTKNKQKKKTNIYILKKISKKPKQNNKKKIKLSL